MVAESIFPVVPDSSLLTKEVVHMDCLMLAHNPKGKERTEKEFEALAKKVLPSRDSKTCLH
ncbi:hypothetical protein ARALYDRAFT_913762 [Arabidopsis lyrata subsp. lyrata]|uniref:Uncharacterized protein n=1 Tax=Arabidopsis lyrata subsp. lyrata TaxID=81972 RepID=D7MDS9_ARALL|nr:hypothetical protein ARALYDRAFT_913762 [Arabidopsis lyrata subsp. lyrata]